MKKRKLLIGISLLALLLVFFSVFSGNPEMNLSERFASPSPEHIFGADGYGRDLLERLSRGSLTSVALGFSVSISSTLIGLLFALSFLDDGPFGALVWSLTDTAKSMPAILIALFLSALFGPGLWIVFIALTISNVPNIARTSYMKMMVLRREEFVLSARLQGMGKARCFIKHMLPHFSGELVSQSIGIFSSSILTEASLSFLGCGIPLDKPSIGGIISEGRRVIFTSPHMVAIPAVILFLLGLALYLIQDGSDLDPVSQ